MSLKKLLMTASALALLTGSALADGGPVPEPPAPPPEPVAPPPEEPAPPPPAPEPFDHWYIAGHGGVVWADDFRFETPLGAVVETDLDTGWGAGGALGYRWENGYRAEMELTYRHNDGDIIFPPIVIRQQILPNVFGVDVDALSAMFNVLYDFDVESFFVPYVGAGIGGTHVTMDIDGVAEDDGWAFSYQFLGGFSIPVSSSVDLFVDYRYLATSGLELEFNGIFDHNDEYRTHNVMGGLRFYF